MYCKNKLFCVKKENEKINITRGHFIIGTDERDATDNR